MHTPETKPNHSYVVFYRSADSSFLLGGVKQSETSRFEDREQAEQRAAGIVDIHAGLVPPVRVITEIREVSKAPEIYRDGSTIGCSWGRAKQFREVC